MADDPASPTAPPRPRIGSIGGLRLFACLHIYAFHLLQAHQAGLLTFGLFDALPTPIARILGRGFVSTGLFFQLSGLLLAYVYLGDDGRPKASDRAFWLGRLARLYPLYFVSLLLLIPAPALLPIMAQPTTPAETAALVATNLTLTQAWFPQYAIAWNAPAWALSAFLLFYAAFPAFARGLAGRSPGTLRRVLLATVVAGLIPATAYSLLDPAGDAATATSITRGGFWLNALRFDPLVWLPQFLGGVVLGRLLVLGRVAAPSVRVVALGDVAAAAIVAALAVVPDVPYVFLRHGLLAPAWLLVLRDLGRGRGLLAKFLAWRGWQGPAEASFGLFALQMPAGLWFAAFALRDSAGTTPQLLGLVATTFAASLLWTHLVQRPLTRSLRRRPSRTARGRGDGGDHDPASDAPTRQAA